MYLHAIIRTGEGTLLGKVEELVGENWYLDQSTSAGILAAQLVVMSNATNALEQTVVDSSTI